MLDALRYLKKYSYGITYHGHGRLCPVCGKQSRKFRQFGLFSREDAQCIFCGSLERHRFLWLFLRRKTNFFDGTLKRVLHVAPESCFESRFREAIGVGYLTADLFDSRAMVKMNIENIEYPDESFDIIYCSHVLEHVQHDKRAMHNFFRVLKENGWAILLVPIENEKTYENPLIVDPVERRKHFGQEDHVRKYGLDYVDRLRDAKFDVKVTAVKDLVQGDEEVRMGLTPESGEIYYCTKGASKSTNNSAAN
jgi:predicted SAM-dependent methyltransferase